MKILLALVVCILTSLSAAAQSLSLFNIDTTNFPTMKAKFHAFDAAGNPIRPNIGDVSITENGTPRTVTNITCPPPVKNTLSVCIMVDTKYHVGLARAGAERLVNFLDMPQDELGITMMDKGVQIHRDFTHDRTKALAAANTIPGAPGVDVQAMFYAPLTGGVPFITGRKTDKKVLILVSDLHCPRLNLNEQQLYADAAKENISVYSILLKAIDYTGLFKRVAANTGGQVFENVATETEITNIFQEIGGAGHWEPCEIIWQSSPTCSTGLTVVELQTSGLKASDQYIKPQKAVTSLLFSPFGIFCKNKPTSTRFDTTVVLTAVNSAFNITNIVPSNPIFDINPKQFSLNAGENKTLKISYTPTDSGYAWTKFDFQDDQNDVCLQKFFASGGFQGKKPTIKSLKLIHPNGGEVFIVGNDTVITWEGIPPSDTVTLEYSIDNGATWTFITNTVSGLSYKWKNIPKPASNQCLVRISQGRNSNNNPPRIDWQKTSGGSLADGFGSIQQTFDGGYIAAGVTKSKDGDVTGLKSNYVDCWVVKLDAIGSIQWQKTLGGYYDDEANSIQQTFDGGYVVAGYTSSSDGDVTINKGKYDFWVVKLDAIGNIQWQKTLGGKDIDEAKSIQQTIDSGYIVAGITRSRDGDVTGIKGADDFWVVKLDAIGNIQWQKTFGGGANDYAYSIRQTFDSGYIVAGCTQSTDGDVTANKGDWDYWIVKLDNIGDIAWQKTLGGSLDDRAQSIQQTIDSGYIIAGTVYSLEFNSQVQRLV